MKRILIIAGEASGDLHGSTLMHQMKLIEPDLSFRGIGGSLMIKEGLDALRHIREMNFMGFAEVIRHLPLIRRTLHSLESLIDTWKPHLAILIDYPGFNLKLAPIIKKRGIPLMYYISPQLWAWHSSRVNLIRRYVDRMVVLFEFEKEFYRTKGVEADFVGHPLLDIVHPSENRAVFLKKIDSDTIPLIGLLPGSRLQEINRILPVMTESIAIVREKIGPVKAVLGCAPDIDESRYIPFIKGTGILPLVGKTYDIMAYSDALMVTSGTATLEAGISGTPMVIVYRTSPLTFQIGKMLVKIPNIGLINIVAGSRIVPELCQDEATPEKISEHIVNYLTDRVLRDSVKQMLNAAKNNLGFPGAAQRAASIAMEMTL
ncbi:MAG: lipid-A-disaccharide synthase [Candidatus Latescibacterota bacterium]